MFIPPDKMKIAFVCLTRGYSDIKRYQNLINRNKALVKFIQNLERKCGYEIDTIIFHEGNIPVDHQAYIQNGTPDLEINFKDVRSGGAGTAFNAAKAENIANTPIIYATKKSGSFSSGYKHMCHFWFVDFLHYVTSYSYLVRVDEDCIMTSFPTAIFKRACKKKYIFVTPTYDAPDVPDVTVGLQTTLSNFMSENALAEKVDLRNIRKTPYTNVCIIDIQYFLNLELFSKFADYIDDANGIYINRWGDLPLWSYFLANMVPQPMYAISKKIKYFHGSHGRAVNQANIFSKLKTKLQRFKIN